MKSFVTLSTTHFKRMRISWIADFDKGGFPLHPTARATRPGLVVRVTETQDVACENNGRNRQKGLLPVAAARGCLWVPLLETGHT